MCRRVCLTSSAQAKKKKSECHGQCLLYLETCQFIQLNKITNKHEKCYNTPFLASQQRQCRFVRWKVCEHSVSICKQANILSEFLGIELTVPMSRFAAGRKQTSADNDGIFGHIPNTCHEFRCLQIPDNDDDDDDDDDGDGKGHFV